MFTVGHSIALAVIAVACVLGTFSWKYNDTWLQRVGMTVTSFACVAGICHDWYGFPPNALHLHVLAYGVGVYAAATIIKRWSRKPWNGSTAAIDWQAIKASVPSWSEDRMEDAILYGAYTRSHRMGLHDFPIDDQPTRPLA